MTRSTRKRIFYVLVLIFFVVSAAVILYAEGWRLGGKDFGLQKVGAIFVRSYPQDATITLDGKPVDNTSGFLSAGTLISNLYPTHYSITLKKPGYLTWSENVSVSPSLVTEFKYAVLVPQNATSAATSTVKDFFIAGGAVVSENLNGIVTWRGGTIGRGDIIAKSRNLKDIILQNPVTGADVFYDLTDKASTSLSAYPNLMIDPYDASTAFAWNAQNVWAISLGASVTPLRIASTTYLRAAIGPSVAVSPSFIAWSVSQSGSTSSLITVYDKFLKMAVSTSVIPGIASKVRWINDGLLGVATQNGSLYRFDASSHALQKIADSVRDFYPTDNGSAVAVLGAQSIEVIPMNNGDYYRFNLPGINTVKNLLWYKDNAHLFVEYFDHIAFLDFSDAGLRNIENVSDGTSPFYDASTNSLYLIDNGQRLIRFDFPN